MLRQDHLPFLAQPSIFLALVRHLTPASIRNFEQTSQHARARVEAFLNDPAQVLLLLGALTREQAAQFFNLYRHYVGISVCALLQDNPDHRLAYTLYAMMCYVNTNMLDHIKLSEAVAYLEEHKFPQRIVDSMMFLISFLWALPANKHGELLPKGAEFYINLRAADLDSRKLDDCDLRGADLRLACLSQVSAKRANFDFADMESAKVTYSDLEQASFVGAKVDRMEEELGFPHMPYLKNARFFSRARSYVSKEQLDKFQQVNELPDFLLEGITKDFIKMQSDEVTQAAVQRLESGMTHPLFATHYCMYPRLWNRYVSRIFTASQREIFSEIDAIKLVLDLQSDDDSQPNQIKLSK